MSNLDKKFNTLFPDHSGINENILEIHQKHIRNHPYIKKYDSAGEYFEHELNIQKIAERYYDIPVYNALRIHSYAQRDFLLLQKNPNLPKNWIESNVHWSYEELAGELPESVRVNSLQTAKTISKYFNKNHTVRIGIKCIIDAVQSEMGCEFEGNALRQSDYEEYIQFSSARSYRDSQEGRGAELNKGFHNDFAYTNRCKFQANGSDANPIAADDEWLADEINEIAPKIIFALGGDAYQGLQKIGFEKTGKESQYSDGNSGRVLKYEGNNKNLRQTYAVHLYHLDYRRNLSTDRDVHDALSTVVEVSDSL